MLGESPIYGMLWLCCMPWVGRADGWLYGLSLLSINARLIGGPLLIRGKTGEDSILGKSEDSIFGVELEEVENLGSGAIAFDMPGLPGSETGMRSIGCSKFRLQGLDWLFLLPALCVLTLSLASLARLLPAASGCLDSCDTELAKLSCRLATLGIGGSSGGAAPTVLFLLLTTTPPNPSLVLGLRLSPLIR